MKTNQDIPKERVDEEGRRYKLSDHHCVACHKSLAINKNGVMWCLNCLDGFLFWTITEEEYVELNQPD